MQTATEKRTLDYILTNIFAGAVIKKTYTNRCKCRKCKVKKKSYAELDRHHITYKPRKLVWLCHKCHKHVTYLNMLRARALGRKLQYKDRLAVWKYFLSTKFTESDYEESAHAMKGWFRK